MKSYLDRRRDRPTEATAPWRRCPRDGDRAPDRTTPPISGLTPGQSVVVGEQPAAVAGRRHRRVRRTGLTAVEELTALVESLHSRNTEREYLRQLILFCFMLL